MNSYMHILFVVFSVLSVFIVYLLPVYKYHDLMAILNAKYPDKYEEARGIVILGHLVPKRLQGRFLKRALHKDRILEDSQVRGLYRGYRLFNGLSHLYFLMILGINLAIVVL